MKKVIRENDYFLLFSCMILGLIAEIAFFQGDIGVSYLIFVSAFYFVFFLRFRLSAFHHRRVGLLFILVIWILSASFLFYGKNIFYTWNLIIIPFVMFIHIIIITRPNTFIWQTVFFMKTMARILYEALFYMLALMKKLWSEVRQHKIMTSIGLLLLIGLVIWMSMDVLLHVLRPLGIGAFIFSIFQVLRDQQVDQQQHIYVKDQRKMIPVTQAMLLSLLLTILMVVTYLIYASTASIYHAFLLLFIVSLVIFTYFYFVLDKVVEEKLWQTIFFKILHTGFIVWNLYFMTIHLQELAYLDELNGMTSHQLIQHAILYFFMIVYLYTLIRIWVKRISLTHFYFIFALLFYMALNMINVAHIVADNQYERYRQGLDVNIAQFEGLSYPGYEKLIQVYEKEASKELKKILMDKAEREMSKKENWQSYNFSRESWLTLFEEKVRQTPIEGEGK